MAISTPLPFQQIGTTTAELSRLTGSAKQIVVDTTKNTLVIFDGSTVGGHPLAKESIKISSGSPNLKINGGSESTLGQDIVITMLPGYVPTGFKFEENPSGQTPGKYLVIDYTDSDGSPKHYYVPAAILVDTYTGGDGIEVNGTNVVSVKLGAGMKFENGAVTIDWENAIDPDSLLTVKSGKLSTKALTLVSSDSGNILKAGSDAGVYLAADLGTL